MSEQSERLRLVRQWVERAEEDRRTAEHLLTIRRHCPFGTVCFHAQQCVEKYIKAILTLQAIEFPKTHDIMELVGLLPTDLHLPLDAPMAERMTAYATLLRYPGDWEPPQWD